MGYLQTKFYTNDEDTLMAIAQFAVEMGPTLAAEFDASNGYLVSESVLLLIECAIGVEPVVLACIAERDFRIDAEQSILGLVPTASYFGHDVEKTTVCISPASQFGFHAKVVEALACLAEADGQSYAPFTGKVVEIFEAKDGIEVNPTEKVSLVSSLLFYVVDKVAKFFVCRVARREIECYLMPFEVLGMYACGKNTGEK
jgi:hypothetical protein